MEQESVASSRATQAAARVAARYAKAPSYSEMQAAEARAALRAAEAATRAALEAQAAAQVALDNLETASKEESEYDEEAASHRRARASVRQDEDFALNQEPVVAASAPPLEIRWEPDMPQRSAVASAAYMSQERRIASAASDQKAHDGGRAQYKGAEQQIEPVEPAQPIHANLIQFPRELVATRRVRPRMAGARRDALGEMFGQLSIFEVDPSTISIEPATLATDAEPPAPSWSGPEWSGIEFDDQPGSTAEDENVAAGKVAGLQLAPLGLRLMASVVDAALIFGTVCVLAEAALSRMNHVPAAKPAELAALAALATAAALYQTLFLILAGITPGMKYAGIALCTFDDEYPTRAQRRARLGATLLSLLPFGLGTAWCIFDEDHLCWHDRLSRTYLRQC